MFGLKFWSKIRFKIIKESELEQLKTERNQFRTRLNTVGLELHESKLQLVVRNKEIRDLDIKLAQAQIDSWIMTMTDEQIKTLIGLGFANAFRRKMPGHIALNAAKNKVLFGDKKEVQEVCIEEQSIHEIDVLV